MFFTLFTACETVVRIDVPKHDPRLSMVYVLEADSSEQIMVYVYPSRGVMQDNFNTEVNVVPGVNLRLLNQQNQIVDSLSCPNCFLGRGAYRPLLNYLPKAGNTYFLQAERAGFPRAQAVTSVPFKPIVTKLEFLPTIFKDGVQNGRLIVEFAKQAGINYYQFEVWVEDSTGLKNQVYADEGSNFDFDFGNTGLEKPFSDESIKQNNFTINRNVSYNLFYFDPFGNAILPVKMVVKVKSLSPELFKFISSEQAYYDASDNPFSEPINMFSNITNGYGLFGARNQAIFEYELKP